MCRISLFGAFLILVGATAAPAQVLPLTPLQIVDRCDAARGTAMLHAQQDGIRVDKAAAKIRGGKVSSQYKGPTELPKGQAGFPSFRDKQAAQRTLDAVGPLANMRFQAAKTGTLVPVLPTDFVEGDVGLLKGQATVVLVLDAQRMVVRGKLGGRPRAALPQDKLELPAGWLAAINTPDQFLDMGYDAQERTVVLYGLPTANRRPDDKVDVNDVGAVALVGKQVFTTDKGRQEANVLQVVDLKSLVIQGTQLRMHLAQGANAPRLGLGRDHDDDKKGKRDDDRSDKGGRSDSRPAFSESRGGFGGGGGGGGGGPGPSMDKSGPSGPSRSPNSDIDRSKGGVPRGK